MDLTEATLVLLQTTLTIPVILSIEHIYVLSNVFQQKKFSGTLGKYLFYNSKIF